MRISLVGSEFNEGGSMSRILVSFRLADDLRQALKERASTEGISTTELVNRLLRQGLVDDKTSFSVEGRLAELESTVQHLLKVFEFERRKREAFFHPGYELERRLVDLEEKLQQISVDVEVRRQRLETLVREKRSATGDDQGAHQKGYSSDLVEVSLEDLRSLLKPASKLTEVE